MTDFSSGVGRIEQSGNADLPKSDYCLVVEWQAVETVRRKLTTDVRHIQS